VTDTSPIYDCPRCHSVQTVVDAGDAQWVYWCKNCKGFFSELDLRKLARIKESDD
jgi:transcription elongation factor Elf1